MSGPSPTPSPEPGPTPTPDVSHVTLPNVPPNTYQLLTALSTAIDTANGNFNTHATKLSGFSQQANGAVSNVTSTSQGYAATALADTWKNTQTDVSHAHDRLTAIIASSCMGGSPNQLQQVLDQHQSDIQTGLTAMENIQMLQRSCPLTPPSAQQVEEWIQQVNALTGALGNVNLTLQVMILAIRNLNGGFSASCATGYTPGMPPPTFPQNSFASMSTGDGGGGGGGGKLTGDQLSDYLKSKGVSADNAELITLWAQDLGLDLDDVKSLLDSGATPNDVLSWLESGKITGANLNDAITLVNQGVSDSAITKLLDSGVNLQGASANITTLLSKGANISDVNQWVQKGLDLKYAESLLDKGIDVNKYINMYTKPLTSSDPGYQRWNNLSSSAKNGIAAAIKRWSTGTYLTDASGNRVGNDGTPFQNRNNEMPGGTTPPYTEYRVDNSGMRIVIDANGKAYFFQDHYNFSGGSGKNAALPVPFSWINQLFQ